jgi:transposase
VIAESVLAFFSLDHRLHPFVFDNVTITSELVIACFDYLCQRLTKPTLVVIDQAPVHTSDEFQARWKGWEARGLYVYPIPASSPELNLIEILWRMIKYHWLPLKAYESYKALMRARYEVLKGVGSKYQIEFAR